MFRVEGYGLRCQLPYSDVKKIGTGSKDLQSRLVHLGFKKPQANQAGHYVCLNMGSSLN